MKLKDIVSIVTDYVANGSFASLRENAKYVGKEEGFARVIRLTDYNNNYYNSDAVYVDENSYKFLSKSKLSSGDIIVTNVGAYLGTVFQCPNLQIPMTLGPNSILIRPNDKVINKYLFYLLSSIYGHNKLLELISGSAMPKFNKTDLKNMEINIHPVEIQQHIVNTISFLLLKSLLLFLLVPSPPSLIRIILMLFFLIPLESLQEIIYLIRQHQHIFLGLKNNH